MHLGRSGAVHCTCPPLGEQGLWGRVSWQRAQPCKGLEARSAGEIPDVDGAGSGGVGSWGTQPNLGLVMWSPQEGGLEPRSWRTWEMGRSEAWGQARVRGRVLK